MAKAIGTLGTIPSLTVGGSVFTDLDNLIVLGGTNSTNAFCTLRKPNGTAGYQVTAGKTLTQRALHFTDLDTAGNSATCSLLYGDTDVGQNAAAAPTTPVYNFGTSAISIVNAIIAGGLDKNHEVSIFFQVPATKYPGATMGAASGIKAVLTYGYEA